MLLNNSKYIILIFILIFISIFFLSDFKDIFTLSYVKENLVSFKMVALSLPIATLLTLISGYIFGLALGTLIVSLCSTVGATIAFLTSKYLFFDFIQKKYKKQLLIINKEFTNEGFLYIFALRLVPIFPFFIVNIVTSLLPIKVHTFFWVSMVGMFPATLVYVNAGNQLSKINSFSDILTFQLFIAFSLIGLLPLTTNFLLKKIKKKKK